MALTTHNPVSVHKRLLSMLLFKGKFLKEKSIWQFFKLRLVLAQKSNISLCVDNESVSIFSWFINYHTADNKPTYTCI